jgi:hydrogenase maturation factor
VRADDSVLIHAGAAPGKISEEKAEPALRLFAASGLTAGEPA